MRKSQADKILEEAQMLNKEFPEDVAAQRVIASGLKILPGGIIDYDRHQKIIKAFKKKPKWWRDLVMLHVNPPKEK